MIKFTIEKSRAGAAWLQAAIMFVGVASVTYGVYIMFHPLGFIFGGALCFGIGMLMNSISEKEGR